MNAMEKVRNRLEKATRALANANIPYAVIGGNAVAVHVARIDESFVRNTRDVDLLIRRSDFDAVRSAFGAAGFYYRHRAGLDVFLEGADAKAGDGVHILFAGEKATPNALAPNPEVDESEAAADFRVLSLEALVRNKLTAYRRKDQVHIQDLIGIGAIDTTWLEKFQPPLAARLKTLLEDPNG